MTISRPRAFRFSALALAVVLAAAGGYAVFGPGTQTPAHARQTASAAPVDVAPVINRPIVDWQRYSGRLEAIDRVDIRPLVSGTLTQVHFKEGALVKKGDLLFTIDPRPYEAQVERAEASAAYTAAKGGVIALSRQLAGELAPDGVRVNSVSPGFIQTPLNAKLRAAGLEQAIAQRIPLRRWGTPEDVAQAARFLVSPAAGFLTGQIIRINGGAVR